MRATICDICGKPMNDTNIYAIKKGLTLKIRPYRHWISYEYEFGFASPISVKDELDICESCMKKMFKWIKDSKEDKTDD